MKNTGKLSNVCARLHFEMSNNQNSYRLRGNYSKGLGAVIAYVGVNGGKVRAAVYQPPKMLRDARTAGLGKPRCGIGRLVQRPVRAD